MASLTSTSGGKIPVDSTVTAQRHTSQHSHEAASASMPLSLTFPYIPLQPARSSQPERQQPLPAESTNTFNPKAKSQIPLLNVWMLRVGRGTASHTCWPVHTNHVGTLENGALTDVMVPYSCQAHKVFQPLMSENFSAECVQPCIGYSCHLFS